ncbi:unnamed protein product [Aureobasidium mustum]|uniref:Uncharacterized protein n=1 Tax=Aureobasidium mustum TaxID=2773714 RepID=A0A9N8P837_9PEZI|nr:unnamed protein product [Aureobasidium mustum]
MPASLTMHTTDSQETLTSNMASTTLRPTKHVHFAPEVYTEKRRSSTASDSFSDSYKHWSPYALTSPTMPRAPKSAHNDSEGRHSSTRHTIPIGSSRRESVESFDDIKRRWSMESLSEESSAIDAE